MNGVVVHLQIARIDEIVENLVSCKGQKIQ